MTLPALPLFIKLAGRPVILIGEGEAAEAKRRLLLRAGAELVGEDADARLAIVALEDEAEALAAVERLRARSVLVNAVDRPSLCDFTLPAIVDRSPVLVAIGTAGVSAGLAAALRQRLELLLPEGLGRLADELYDVREQLRTIYPDAAERRRAIAAALAPGGIIDPLGPDPDVVFWLMDDRSETPDTAAGSNLAVLTLRSPDPDELTLRQARLLANADRIFYAADVPAIILARARADAVRISAPMPADPGPGLSVEVIMA